MMNKTTKKIFAYTAAALIVLLAAVYGWMFHSVNAAYPQNQRVTYQYGKTFSAQGADFQVTGAKLLPKSEILKDRGLVDVLKKNGGYVDETDLNLAIIDLKISNKSSEKIRIDLTSFHLESGAFSLQLDYPLAMYLNQCGMYPELNGKEVKNIKAAVPIEPDFFTDYSFEKVKSRTYYLVYTLYPKKQMAEIRF